MTPQEIKKWNNLANKSNLSENEMLQLKELCEKALKENPENEQAAVDLYIVNEILKGEKKSHDEKPQKIVDLKENDFIIYGGKHYKVTNIVDDSDTKDLLRITALLLEDE